jgi:thiol-disulfide isomerase/thioredoxin
MKKSVLVIIILLGLVLVGCSTGNLTPSIEPAKKRVVTSFKELYPEAGAEHPFTEVDVYQVVKKLEGNAIIFFGFPECPKCHQIVTALTEAANLNEVETIYYFNPVEVRTKNTKEYQTITTYLAEILPSNEKGEPTINVPLVVFIKEGHIINYHAGSVNEAPIKDKTLSVEQKAILVNIFDKAIKEMNK